MSSIYASRGRVHAIPTWSPGRVFARPVSLHFIDAPAILIDRTCAHSKISTTVSTPHSLIPANEPLSTPYRAELYSPNAASRRLRVLPIFRERRHVAHCSFIRFSQLTVQQSPASPESQLYLLGVYINIRSTGHGCSGGRQEHIRDRKSTRLNSSHSGESRMPSSA